MSKVLFDFIVLKTVAPVAGLLEADLVCSGFLCVDSLGLDFHHLMGEFLHVNLPSSLIYSFYVRVGIKDSISVL